MTLPRMRTIKEAAEEIKQTDPQTAIREYFIRDLVVNNRIPYVRAGRKILINMDKLYEYLQNGSTSGTSADGVVPEGYGVIRAVHA